jgi:hypothetical protein
MIWRFFELWTGAERISTPNPGNGCTLCCDVTYELSRPFRATYQLQANNQSSWVQKKILREFSIWFDKNTTPVLISAVSCNLVKSWNMYVHVQLRDKSEERRTTNAIDNTSNTPAQQRISIGNQLYVERNFRKAQFFCLGEFNLLFCRLLETFNGWCSLTFVSRLYMDLSAGRCCDT